MFPFGTALRWRLAFFGWLGLPWLVGCERWDLPRQVASPTGGLVAHYSFSGTVLDASGKNLNGQLVNGPTYGPDRNLKAESALVLDGVDDYFEVPDNALFRSEAISISLWMKPSQVTSTCHLYTKASYATLENQQYSAFIQPPYSIGDGKGPGIQLLADINQDGSCTVELPLKDPAFYYDPGFQLNRWYHFVAVFTPTSGKIYLDGELKADNASLPGTPIDPCTGGNLRFGAQAALDLNPFKGALDDIRVYNRALSAAEVKALFQQ